MSINLGVTENIGGPVARPRITVFGVGGAGCNAVNNMIQSELDGVNFVVANTDAQALSLARTDSRIQLGNAITQGLGAGSRPEVGRAAAEESLEEILTHLEGCHMAFITAGMGGGTGTGAAPILARAAKERGILTVGVVTKPFDFEGTPRMRVAEMGIEELEQYVDTLIVIPNQNLFRVANDKTSFADAFKMADDVLYAGVRGVTDLMIKPGLINLDFADIRSVMTDMGKAKMGTGEATGDKRALEAAEAAISNPLLEDTNMAGAKGVLINVSGSPDMTLYELDEAAHRIRSEVNDDAFVIVGAALDESLEDKIRITVVATGMSSMAQVRPEPKAFDVFVAPQPKVAAPAVKVPEPVIVAEPAAAAEPVEAEPEPMVEPQIDFETMEAEAPVEQPAAIRAAVGDPRPAMMPGTATNGTFIPRAPVAAHGAETAERADPMAEADFINGRRENEPARTKPVRPRGPTLFEKVTGAARLGRERTEPAQEAPAEPKPAAKEPTLGAVNPDERLVGSQGSEDLLDIPAFLRRQAS